MAAVLQWWALGVSTTESEAGNPLQRSSDGELLVWFPAALFPESGKIESGRTAVTVARVTPGIGGSECERMLPHPNAYGSESIEPVRVGFGPVPETGTDTVAPETPWPTAASGKLLEGPSPQESVFFIAATIRHAYAPITCFSEPKGTTSATDGTKGVRPRESVTQWLNSPIVSSLKFALQPTKSPLEIWPNATELARTPSYESALERAGLISEPSSLEELRTAPTPESGVISGENYAFSMHPPSLEELRTAPTPTLAPPTPPELAAAAVQPFVRQGGVLSEAEMDAVLEAAGWPRELWGQAKAVAMCESRWSPYAVGDSGNSLGLFQLNVATWFRYAGEDPAHWADPLVNARTAWATYNYDLSRGYAPWKQWTCKP